MKVHTGTWFEVEVYQRLLLICPRPLEDPACVARLKRLCTTSEGWTHNRVSVARVEPTHEAALAAAEQTAKELEAD